MLQLLVILSWSHTFQNSFKLNHFFLTGNFLCQLCPVYYGLNSDTIHHRITLRDQNEVTSIERSLPYCFKMAISSSVDQIQRGQVGSYVLVSVVFKPYNDTCTSQYIRAAKTSLRNPFLLHHFY